MCTRSRKPRLPKENSAVAAPTELRFPQREYTAPAAHHEPAADSLKTVLQSCRRRLRSWRVPPNWSPGNWFEEIKAITEIAAWEAGCAHDPSSGIKYEAFVYQKVMAVALTHYRQEWTYALRFCSADEHATTCPRSSNGAFDSDGFEASSHIPLSGTSVSPAYPLGEDLKAALTTLSQAQRQLIKSLFSYGYSEAMIGEALGISQRAVSKRKHVILELLRERLLSS